MALVNKESALQKVVNALKKSPCYQGVEILSYKRNRGISIIKESEDLYWVRERGYEELESRVTHSDLPRILKSMMKREFPRSRKLRVYQLSSPEDAGIERKKL